MSWTPRVLTVLLSMASLAASVAPRAEGSEAVRRGRRYQVHGTDFVITNGERRFNRPLYGSNTIFYVHGGDRPEFLLSLPGKGGTFRLGIASGKKAKWLPDADDIVARYRGGSMRYEIRDGLLGDGVLTVDAVPMGEAEGLTLRVQLSGGASGLELLWAFGGASGFNRRNLDTCGYCPESVCWLDANDCEGNKFRMTEFGFELLAPCHQSRPVAGTMPPGFKLRIGDAGLLDSPLALLASRGDRRPILAGRRAVDPGEGVYFALEWLPKDGVAIPQADLRTAFDKAEAHRRSIVDRVRVSAPDPVFGAAAAAICSAGDGLWDPPTYTHGGVRWHFPYLGWRGAYIASEFGWHDRARTHFREFAKVQLKEPATAEPRPDKSRDLARQASDSVLYSRGYIPVFPKPDARGAYDMQQVYIDQLLWHFLWTGDVDFVREMWPVILDHLAWEKRCFDPDGDGLFENYANTLISDAHHYSGGACTQASAYNYRAFSMAARLASLIGEDPEPFRRQAEKIRKAMNKVLWMPERGWYAEYRDLLGLKRLHPSAELPSVYHPIDSDVPDMFQAWQMLRYVDTQIEHVPVEGDSMTIWTSNWVPWIWSVRDILGSEVAHTALAYWQSGRREKAYQLYRGAIVDAMLCSHVAGACQGTSEYSRRNAGVATDFSCSVGMFGRVLVEGLFGIVPDVLSGELWIRPGLPKKWDWASINTPDVGYSYSRQRNVDEYAVRANFSRPVRLRLRAAARGVKVAEVTVNEKKTAWKNVPGIGEPVIEVETSEADGAQVRVRWDGDQPATVVCPTVVGAGERFRVEVGPARLVEIKDPQRTLKDVSRHEAALEATAGRLRGHRTVFVRVEQGDLSWWLPVPFEIRDPVEISDASAYPQLGELRFVLRNNTDQKIAGMATVACGTVRRTLRLDLAARSSSAPIRLTAQGLLPGTNPMAVDLGDGRTVRGAVVDWQKPDPSSELPFELVDLQTAFNDRVMQIFNNEYRTPRSPYCSLQMPLRGFGDWCYGGRIPAPKIDDSALRAAAGEDGRFVTPQGVLFTTPGPGEEPNIVFTSRWDNFPAEVVIPLSGRARHAWFLVAGSTHPMHSQFDNGEILVTYTDGTSDRLPLHNPSTWWPIEADYQVDIDRFCIPEPHPPRIDLGSGRATLLDLPLDPKRRLRSLIVRCLANETVVGLMSATLLRP